MAHQQLGAAITRTTDQVTKQYVDSAVTSSGGTTVTDNGDGTYTINAASSAANAATLIVGQTNTLGTNKGIWVQTDASGNLVNVWFENGL